VEPGRVVVVDGGTVSAGTVLIADAIQRRLERGTSVESIVELASRVQRSSGYVFTVATLEYLIRGGRVSRTAGLAGELLSAKPILRIADGEIAVVKRVRGRARALAELEHLLVAETSDGGAIHTAVVHAECPADMEQLEQRVRAVRPQASVDHRLVFGPVIGANSGPGSLALAWLADDGR
jgi:DegV family protein with EDD domain